MKIKGININNKNAIRIIFAALFFISMGIGTCLGPHHNTSENKWTAKETIKYNKKELAGTIYVLPKTNEAVAELPKTPGGDEIASLINVNDDQKVAYLTFDDGPSSNNTPVILDILQKENIKATFFIIGQNAEKNPEMLKKERTLGETIGMHSYCHNTSIIYRNPDAYLNDLDRCSKVMTNILGEKGYDNKLIRFPEGSSAVKNKPGFRDAIAKAGYHYVDWNALVGDAEKSTMASPEYLMNRLKTTVGNQHHVVILMHDAQAKESTAATLPEVIDYLKDNGFTFETIPEYR